MKEFVPGELTEHLVPNKMPGDSLKQVTQLLHPDWMMGGLWGSQRAWNQIKAGTIHWNNATGETEWLLAPGDGKTNIRVTKTGMIIYRADEKSSSINLYVYARDLSKVNFSEKVWRFSAIELTVNTKLKRSWHKITDSKVLNEECAISEEYHGVMKITFQVPATWRKEEPLLEIIPTK